MSSGAPDFERGQSAVETALTLPLTLFLILGTLQLFMAMQGRFMAHLAVARATRAGSVTSGDCTAMTHSALLALLPTFTETDGPTLLAQAFKKRNGGMFSTAEDDSRDEAIVWIDRVSPTAVSANEEEAFDLGSTSGGAKNPTNVAHTLEVKMLFWYPLRIPFADWVFSKMALAQWNLSPLSGANPLMLAESHPHWNGSGLIANLDSSTVSNELLYRDSKRHYSMPIQVTYSMHMMTPTRPENFTSHVCPCGTLAANGEITNTGMPRGCPTPGDYAP
jgi:TadE-like protein